VKKRSPPVITRLWHSRQSLQQSGQRRELHSKRQ